MKTLRSFFCAVAIAFTPLATLGPPTLSLALTAAGCNLSPRAHAFVTLDGAQAAVFEALNQYGLAFRAGKISAQTDARVQAAYDDFQKAFDASLLAAEFDVSKATPDNVHALADTLLGIIANLTRTR